MTMAQRKAAAVSMDPEQHEKAVARAKDLGFATFSGYVVALIRNDLIARGELTMRDGASDAKYCAKKKETR